jgi:uncharacterized protein
MSALRKPLKHPATYLLALLLLMGLATFDSTRPPAHQFTAQAYVAMIRVYQRAGSPLLAGFVRCRYVPTCSEYSQEAVRKYGIRKGLALTVERLWRCRSQVPMRTLDPLR